MDKRDYDPGAVRAARVKLGLSQREAGRRIELRNETISRIECGRRVSFDHLKRLAVLYGADVRDWLCRTEGR